MRSRDKFLILLFSVTLGLGTLILLDSRDNDEVVLRLKSLFSNRALHNLRSPTTMVDGPGLWYGGISLFAILMIGLALKLASSGNSQTLKERLAELQSAKAETEKLLREATLKEKHARQAKDVALQNLELSARKIFALENDLREKQELLQKPYGEVKPQVTAFIDQAGATMPAKGTEEESPLQEELRKKADLLQARDSAITELENSLGETRKLLQNRSKDLEAFKSKVNSLTEQLANLSSAKEQKEKALQQQLKKKTELLQSKETAGKQLLESLNTEVQALERELTDKEKALNDRDADLQALHSKVNSLTEVGLAREQAKSVLLQELQNRTELLQAKDSNVKELQRRLSATAQALEDARAEVERLLKERDTAAPTPTDAWTPEQSEDLLRPRRKGLNSRLHELGAVKARAAGLLQVQQAKQALNLNDANIKELEEGLRRFQDQGSLTTGEDGNSETGVGKAEGVETETDKKEPQ
jgi:hypothetical protein